MKNDLQIIAEKALSLKKCNQNLKEETLNKMLKVYYLQNKKNNITKANERLKFLNVIS